SRQHTGDSRSNTSTRLSQRRESARVSAVEAVDALAGRVGFGQGDGPKVRKRHATTWWLRSPLNFRALALCLLSPSITLGATGASRRFGSVAPRFTRRGQSGGVVVDV